MQWLVQRFRSEKLRVRSQRSATYTPSALARKAVFACLATDVKINKTPLTNLFRVSLFLPRKLCTSEESQLLSRKWLLRLTLRRSRVKDVHNSRLRLGFQNRHRLPKEYSTTGRHVFPMIRMRERRQRLSKLLTTTHECETTSFPVNCHLARSNMTPEAQFSIFSHAAIVMMT